jgi:hypothetical protein
MMLPLGAFDSSASVVCNPPSEHSAVLTLSVKQQLGGKRRGGRCDFAPRLAPTRSGVRPAAHIALGGARKVLPLPHTN